MIRAASEAALAALRPESEAAVKLRCLWEAYGTQTPFLRFFEDEHGGLLSQMDGQAVWYMPPASETAREEWLLFLTMQPEVRAVRTEAEAARMLASYWQTQAETGVVMTPGRRFAVPDMAVSPLEPRALYPLLWEVFGDGMPPFEAWYVDVSHRLRHGQCRVAGIQENGEPAAGAMTTAECREAAVIGAVATRKQSRGRGYAGACVTALATALQAEEKCVLLSPKNAYARRLYERMGFVACDRWGSVVRP